MPGVEIAVIGAGAIGRAHAEQLARKPGQARLAAIVDPSPAAEALARRLGVPWRADVEGLLVDLSPQAAIVATPNDTHLPISEALLTRKIPVLVEKPIASTVAEAEALSAASRAAGVAVLVGHHRRHNPIIRAARAMLQDGRLGRVVSYTGIATFLKPDPYFFLEWRRRRPGGGPVLINLIHEIDLVRHLCGEILSVQALASNAVRGFEVEDTAAVLLQLAGGALATISLSDTAAAPWNWDLIARESAHYPPQPLRANSHFIAGTSGALALPQLEYWRYTGASGWHEPMSADVVAHEAGDPYLAQIAHFCRVVLDGEAPLVDADDAAETLRATLAVQEAARSGSAVRLD